LQELATVPTLSATRGLKPTLIQRKVQTTASWMQPPTSFFEVSMSRIQIENGYSLCVLHRQSFTHLLLEQTLADGSIVLHGEKKLSQTDLAAFFANTGTDVEGIKATLSSLPSTHLQNGA
jgi:hypothetical protein